MVVDTGVWHHSYYPNEKSNAATKSSGHSSASIWHQVLFTIALFSPFAKPSGTHCLQCFPLVHKSSLTIGCSGVGSLNLLTKMSKFEMRLRIFSSGWYALTTVCRETLRLAIRKPTFKIPLEKKEGGDEMWIVWLECFRVSFSGLYRIGEPVMKRTAALCFTTKTNLAPVIDCLIGLIELIWWAKLIRWWRIVRPESAQTTLPFHHLIQPFALQRRHLKDLECAILEGVQAERFVNLRHGHGGREILFVSQNHHNGGL